MFQSPGIIDATARRNVPEPTAILKPFGPGIESGKVGTQRARMHVDNASARAEEPEPFVPLELLTDPVEAMARATPAAMSTVDAP